MDMLEAVKENLNIDFCDDDEFIKQKISAAVNYAEDYQHMAVGYYSENAMPAATQTKSQITRQNANLILLCRCDQISDTAS